jgi:4-hydroxy-2-oxoheptanedioate aldolase
MVQMLNSWRPGSWRNLLVNAAVTAGLAVAVALVLPAGPLRAQLPPLKPAHLNPMIEKLAAGKAVFGPIISDLSMTSARTWARSGADYVWIDMEHSPLNMDAVNQFVAYANDKAHVAQRGDTQPRISIVARFPPYGGADPWIVKQALDMGLMGVVFNTVNTKEEAIAAVRSMRYPPQRNDPATQKGPIGMRGFAPGGALWNWGISGSEYQRRADLWPLNPNGDLLANLMIETREGVKNIDEIASVPGVGVIEAAAGGDLASELGIANQGNTPEVEALRQTILKACLSHNVVCGILASGKAQIDQRLKEGWRHITTPSGTAAQ